MRSSVLFVPLPMAQSNAEIIAADMRKQLGNYVSDLLRLINQTKSNNPDPDSFILYINTLIPLKNTPFHTKWTHPFKSTQVITGTTFGHEILFTAWNYLAFLHRCIASQDVNTADGIKALRKHISKANAVVNIISELLCEISDTFITTDLLGFICHYHEYAASLWQLAAVVDANKGDKVTMRCISTCITQIKITAESTRNLDEITKSYCRPITVALKCYHEAHLRNVLANTLMSDLQYGAAIKHLQIAEGIIKGSDAQISFAPSLSMANQFIANATTTTLQMAISKNKEIYKDSVPVNEPELPKPLPGPFIEPDETIAIVSETSGYSNLPGSSQSPAGGQMDAPQFDDNPQGVPDFPTGGQSDDVPDFPMPSPSSSTSTTTSSTVSTPSDFSPYNPAPPQPFQPQAPQFQPSQQPSSNYQQQPFQPQAPQFQPSQQPSSNYQYPPSQSYGNAPRNMSPFPLWEQVQMKKQSIRQKMQYLMNAGYDRNALAQWSRDLDVANRSDDIIQRGIDAFMAGASRADKNTIDGQIQMAFNFYSSFERKVANL